jgi:hypothetical protein
VFTGFLLCPPGRFLIVYQKYGFIQIMYRLFARKILCRWRLINKNGERGRAGTSRKPGTNGQKKLSGSETF